MNAPDMAAEPASGRPEELVGVLAAARDAASLPRLGRSLAIHALHAGDCGGCGLEWASLRGAAHGLEPHGFIVQDSPVGADVLLVMGALTTSLADPVRRALAVMAQPRWVVAVGGCAIDGGPFAGSEAVLGGVAAAVPVDLALPGCPPEPLAILAALGTLMSINAG